MPVEFIDLIARACLLLYHTLAKLQICSKAWPMFPRLSSTYVGHAKAWQYYERRIIRTCESRRLWAELCHDDREEPVLIRT